MTFRTACDRCQLSTRRRFSWSLQRRRRVVEPETEHYGGQGHRALKPVEVMVDVRNTSAADPDGLCEKRWMLGGPPW